MQQLQTILDTAVAAGDMPFAVAMTANRAGTIFSGAAGNSAPGHAADTDTVFRLFSMTKGIGSLAAMILIDRGQLTLETPVADILPAWDSLRVLDGWDGAVPRMRAPKTRATLRHLLTHTSGLEYAHWNADMVRYIGATGYRTTRSGLMTSLTQAPLMFDPGTRWGYGPSTDWLGQVVEAVSGQSIVTFCQTEILDPLRMTATAFEPTQQMQSHLAQVSSRDASGGFVSADVSPPSKPEFYGMGHALYGTAPDYIRFLRMILNDGVLDGVRILSPVALKLMLAEQMHGLKVEKMHSAAPHVTADFDPFPEVPLGHSAAFVRNARDIPDRRRAGAQTWAGILNTHFWIDPASDLAAVLMTQSLPFVEPRFMQTYERFERTVYAGL